MRIRLSFLLPALLSASLLGPVRADEATLEDGRRLAGALRLDKTGKLVFAPQAGAPVSLAKIAEVRATAADLPVRMGSARRLRLADRQQLTGAFLGLEKKGLVLRPAWADKLQVPRDGAGALSQLPGWLGLVEDDLCAVGKGWKTAGSPAGGPAGVQLEKAGQSLSHAAPPALIAGRIGVTFEAREGAGGARWLLEATFAAKAGPQVLRIAVASPGGHYQVEAVGLEGTALRVARSAGPHRLVVRFSPRSVRVECDNEVLWYNLEKGTGGALTDASMKCLAADKGGPSKGAVVWTDFRVERELAELPRPPGDPTQDELWLATGDQVFGKVVRADRQEIALEGRFGTRTFAWSELRGWFPRRAAGPPKVIEGQAVRLGLRNGLTADEDVLNGVVTALDEKHLALRHALLGEVRIDRRFLARVRPR